MAGTLPGADDKGLQATRAPQRVLTVPNILSIIRLLLVPVFLYLLLVTHTDGWATAILMFSGVSDWADGKIARLMNQSSRLGELLDPFVDRVFMVTVPIAFALRDFVPWWFVIVLIGRDVLLAFTLPPLRKRGLAALPVTYLGKAATFGLMCGFPLILLGQFDGLWSRVVLAIGWGFVLWGFVAYLWTFVLYLIQFTMVMRQLPVLSARGGDGRG